MKVEIYKDKKKEFRIRIKAKNGKILLVSSESYVKKANALKAVSSVINNVSKSELSVISS